MFMHVSLAFRQNREEEPVNSGLEIMKPKHRRRVVCTFLFAAIVIGIAGKEQSHPRVPDLPHGFVALGLPIRHDFTPEELARMPGTYVSMTMEIRNAAGTSTQKTVSESILVLAVDRPRGWWEERIPTSWVVTFAVTEKEKQNLVGASEMGILEIEKAGLWPRFRKTVREQFSYFSK
jgi:hypothetical protein